MLHPIYKHATKLTKCVTFTKITIIPRFKELLTVYYVRINIIVVKQHIVFGDGRLGKYVNVVPFGQIFDNDIWLQTNPNPVRSGTISCLIFLSTIQDTLFVRRPRVHVSRVPIGSVEWRAWNPIMGAWCPISGARSPKHC